MALTIPIGHKYLKVGTIYLLTFVKTIPIKGSGAWDAQHIFPKWINDWIRDSDFFMVTSGIFSRSFCKC